MQILGDIGIRKAAILVASLDRKAADAVLEQLTPEQSRRVRQAVVILNEISDDEQKTVIDEFFQNKPRAFPEEPSGIDLQSPLAAKYATRNNPSKPANAAPVEQRKPFVALREAEANKLARLLSVERAQTIALVLAHLTARQAGAVLSRLEPNLQAEVTKRLVYLEETDPAILREVEEALESRLSQQVHMQRRRVAGLKALGGILEASEDKVRMQIMNNLATHDQSLLQRIMPEPMEFDELIELDDSTLLEVFRAVDPLLIMPALLGAAPDLSERVLGLLPRTQSLSIRRKLQQPGPIHLSDVETARQQIAEMAAKLLFVKKATFLRAA
ncbi:MAG: FliG C-terminal domain-containing protein [Thermoguttaceae bacterium]